MGSMLNMQNTPASPGLAPFHFGGVQVRIVTDDEGAPWFVAQDVCVVLGLGTDQTRRLDEDEKGLFSIQTPGGEQQMVAVNESGLYSLVLGSRKPEAKLFKKWITKEVLPTIRRTGSYSVVDPLANLPAEQRALVGLMLDAAAMKKVQAEQGAAIARIEQRVEEAAQAQLMLARPANAESIVHIRERINKAYGLPAWIVDTVLRQSLYAPKPAGMVKNTREEARGASYAVYWTKDITALFARFVSECIRVTRTQAPHPLIDKRFQLTSQEVTHAQS